MQRANASENETFDDLFDEVDLQSIADSEIHEVQAEAKAWLVANNRSDQRAVAAFAVGLAICGVALWEIWAFVVAVCILGVLPFRWIAAPYFGRGEIKRGLIWTNIGSWYLVFPLVAIIPETLPISIQNVIGPMVLAAAYLDRATVRRLVPAAVAVAIAVSLIGLTFDGAGIVDRVHPAVFYPVLLAYVGANLMLVMNDLRESNQVRLRVTRRAIRTSQQLTAADQALRNSRRRLLVAADHERRRLETNLHDGAQQRLVSLALQLRLAADLAEEGTPPSSAALHQLHHETTEAIDELRELARGVYPARLRELGLAQALRSVARQSPLPINVVDEMPYPALNADTEVALYFVCSEAIQNATKHGDDDTSITVALRADDDDLIMSIDDTGPGFDTERRPDSHGLTNMSDRVGALGGQLDIESAPGSGTRVAARLPDIFQPVLPTDAGAT